MFLISGPIKWWTQLFEGGSQTGALKHIRGASFVNTIPTERSLSEPELHALICELILKDDASGHGYVAQVSFQSASHLAGKLHLSNEAGQAFCRQNANFASPRKLSEFFGNLVSRNILCSALDQTGSLYYVTDQGRPILQQYATRAEFESTEFVEFLRDLELRERCLDVLQRTRQIDSLVRDAMAVLEDRLKEMPDMPAQKGRRSLAPNALHPDSGIYLIGDDRGQQDAAQQLFQGMLGFFANPIAHGLHEIDSIEGHQIVGFVDTLLNLLSQATRR